jgi:peptidoglycan/xylan/chitin deacetylase (PgdA/CDA1 family)
MCHAQIEDARNTKIGREAARLARRAAHLGAEFAPTSLLIRRLRVRDRSIALTFDDGPDEQTPLLLDLLDRHRLRATFFLLGENAARFPQYVTAIAERGHEIASHGYCHRSLATMSRRELALDLAQTHLALAPHVVTSNPRLFRPPRGIVTLPTLAWTAREGYSTVLWSFDSLDWRHAGSGTIAERFASHPFSPGDIVLMHEGEADTRESIARIAETLRHKNLHSIPVSSLLERRVPAGKLLTETAVGSLRALRKRRVPAQ